MVSLGLDSSLGLEGEEQGPQERGLGAEQEEGPTLREAWKNAKGGKGEVRSGARVELHQGILYRVHVDPKTKEEMSQLVLPIGRRGEALRTARDCPLGGTWARRPPPPDCWRGFSGLGYIEMLRNIVPVVRFASSPGKGVTWRTTPTYAPHLHPLRAHWNKSGGTSP